MIRNLILLDYQEQFNISLIMFVEEVTQYVKTQLHTLTNE